MGTSSYSWSRSDHLPWAAFLLIEVSALVWPSPWHSVLLTCLPLSLSNLHTSSMLEKLTDSGLLISWNHLVPCSSALDLLGIHISMLSSPTYTLEHFTTWYGSYHIHFLTLIDINNPFGHENEPSKPWGIRNSPRCVHSLLQSGNMSF